MHALHDQFDRARTNIEVNGEKRQRAIDAHTEIQDLLSDDEQLRAWGINTRLIGSYSRKTAIYPGKDVDVFSRFECLDTSASPDAVYGRVEEVLVEEYRDVANGGRVTPQARSIKVDFPDSRGTNASFAVDAVPAVRDGRRWAIPTKDRNLWAPGQHRWVTTDPERLGDLSSELNTAPWSPTVGGQGAYKPIVKLMRQAREVHLGDRKPGGLYVEFAVYDLWVHRQVTGDEWGPLFASTLSHVANRFSLASLQPLVDPGLGTPVDPSLDVTQWEHASATFSSLATLASEALSASRCEAALKWRRILGTNARGQVFPLPPGCGSTGPAAASLATVAATRPSEARSFG